MFFGGIDLMIFFLKVNPTRLRSKSFSMGGYFPPLKGYGPRSSPVTVFGIGQVTQFW